MTRIVVLEGEHGEALVERLKALGIQAVRAPTFDEAQRVVEVRVPLTQAVLLPVALAELADLKSQLKTLARCGPASGLSCLAYGAAPDRAARKRLRSAGVKLGLWEPFDDGTLRFQVNRAISGEREEHGRRAPRVPTYLIARVGSGGREKDAVVYSLSTTGAFLETPRASMEGAKIVVEIRLPGAPARCAAVVRYANVLGNLKRPNLPLGMGVQFEDVPPEDGKRIKEYVERRLAQLEV